MLNITFLLGLLAPRPGPRRVPRLSRVHPVRRFLRWHSGLHNAREPGCCCAGDYYCIAEVIRVQHGENDRARVHAAQIATIKKESGHRDAAKVAAWHASHIP